MAHTQSTLTVALRRNGIHLKLVNNSRQFCQKKPGAVFRKSYLGYILGDTSRGSRNGWPKIP